MLPGPIREFGPAGGTAAKFGSTYVELRFRVASDEAAAAARVKVLAALDRLEAELDAGGSKAESLRRSQRCFTIGQALSLSGRAACSAGTVASSLR